MQFRAMVTLLCVAGPVIAQSAKTPPKLAPCDTSSVLAHAQPIFDVGTATLTKACPAFSKRISDWYKATPAAHQWSAGQIIAALVAPPVDTTPAPRPPVQGNAPEPTSTSTILFRDDFERAAASISAGYAKRGTSSLTDGHAGAAIRFSYGANSDDNLIEKAFTITTDLYVRYWFRLSKGADPTCGGSNPSGMKWFMLWRSVGNRYTMGVGDLGGTRLAFTSHDNGSTDQPNPFEQNITKAVRFGTVNDGQWHKYTAHVVTGPAGYEQLWIDGTLILDNSANTYGHEAGGIALIQLPGAVVNIAGCSAFSIDVDELAVWAR